MDIRALRYFVEVVQLNGFSRASDTLCVTQPAISRTIQHLEDELGFKLLIREVDGVKLTDEGSILFDQAKELLRQFNEIKHSLKDKSGPLKGTLNVGIPPIISSTYFADIILTFTKLHPQVELKIFEMGTNKIIKALNEGTIETATVVLPLSDHNFDIQKCSTERLALIVNKSHSFASKKEIQFIELLQQPLILFADDFRINDLINSACGIHSAKPIIAGRSNHLDLITAMVKAGVGITLLPESMWEQNSRDDLIIIPVIDPILSYEIALVNVKSIYQSRSCQSWNQLVLDKFLSK
ncbi:DNA-binding transcriptional regulator [Commensalibacter communis]|uniref:LysR family transcriptional regulator n=1 Tax=Commensalibacter communis TaxID=2972786 RepID=UPI0022FFAFB4|nr:LysR family transcriptional regulator [Commensalibacter communis]CAI3949330.1 DNA-binding transcriptional regulator [Commensalibacter communis]